MKKISTEWQAYLNNKSRKTIRARTKKKQSRLRACARRIKKSKQGTYPVKINVPVLFRVRSSKDRQPFMAFISKVDYLLRAGRHVHLDLSGIQELHPCGTLIFLAKLEIWTATNPGKLTGSYPNDTHAEQMLQYVGALNRLGLSPRQTITSERVLPWHFHSGTKVAADAYENLTASVLGSDLEHPEKQLFADCLNEAVDNTVGHAYKFHVGYAPQASLQKWWIFSLSEKDRVFVSIFDSGVTIPRSLRRRQDWKTFLRNRAYWKDSRLISAAATSEKTSTKLPHRGKGLPEMVEFSKNLSSGGLSILSGGAAFVYDAENDLASHKSLDCYIPGTLVLWNLPFQKGESE